MDDSDWLWPYILVVMSEYSSAEREVVRTKGFTPDCITRTAFLQLFPNAFDKLPESDHV